MFERFLSAARNEPPDIDVDFEHERREEVMQYIYNKYGRDRAAIVATVTQQHQKGAVRDVAKAMGLSPDTVNRLAKSVWEFTGDSFDNKAMQEQGIDTGNAHLKKYCNSPNNTLASQAARQHTGGFVITQQSFSSLPHTQCKNGNRPV